MIKILKYFKKEDWLKVAISIVFIVSQVWLDLKIPDYMREITSAVQKGSSSTKEIWIIGGYMLLCAFGSLIASFVVGYFAARIAASFSKRLRSMLFDKVEAFSMEEMNQFSTSSLITRSTNDITQVQMIIAMGLQIMIKSPILAVWAICKIAGKGWEWSAATAGAVGCLILMSAIIILFAIPKFRKIQGLTDNLNKVTRENLMGIRVVRAYNAEEFQTKKFEIANEQLTSNYLSAHRTMAIILPGMTLIMNGLSLSIYWIGAYLIDQASLMERMDLFSNMVVYSSYAMQIVFAFMMLTMIFIMLPRATVSAKRILEVLNCSIKMKDGTKSSPKGEKGTIVFDHVSFQYPQAAENMLQDISFRVNQGETVAIIGSTGSGKSTLMNLIPRFYDVTEGSIIIDGMNVKDYKISDLHEKIGYVSQKAVMFSGTVASNVAFGKRGKEKATLDDVKRAVSIAQGKDFVEGMTDTYEAVISQGGTNVSGGQKQRLSIARAICVQPEILIFDDSFSALDYKTDRELRSILNKETKEITKLIVAQRIGTIKDADQIIVLDKGEIVGKGTHQELLKNCCVYQEIAYSQLSKEELTNE